MTNSFLNSINVTRTSNGAATFKSSSSKVMDFFALGGALRTRTEADVKSMFADAYAEDKNLALKTAFYLRDVRGGQGERKVFRIILKWLAENDPDAILKNLENIPEFGRWDDLFTLFDTSCEKETIGYIKRQLEKDIEQCMKME